VEDGNCRVLELDTQEGVQNAIFNKVHRKQYNLAEEAPIHRGFLRGQFGYMPTSPTARAVLDESYDFPPGIDNATKELFEECAKIRSIIPVNSVTGAISRERWQQRWKKVEEDTSLSGSWSWTPRKGYRMQSSMRCIGSNTIWRRRPRFAEVFCEGSLDTCRLLQLQEQS
jgi:hypothetical protein